ncbi:carbohydrate esterase family 10 protein [Rhizoctonia solani]|uniref:Carbohydrate esterase family 10 protein n=1 Tax=Rhizoctonia solani TaxID=456999 RepID=A0A8H8NMD3_9AGAM|nr:carbohydrate esterase family 10 protein [Rhizoctonia solani]QRW15910.1 carbohydrate esterase family 10 protein [Rhizoctonia solani]
MDPLTRILHIKPFGSLYMLYKRIVIIAKIPFQVVSYLLGINKLRPSWTLKKVLILSALREVTYISEKTGINGGRDHTKEVVAKDCLDAHFIWVDGVPDELIVGEVKRLAQVCGAQSVCIPAYGFGRWNSTQDLARDGEKIILNLHGGGYIAGTAHPEDLTANIPRGYLAHGISRVLSIDYRLSTTHPYPTAAPFPSALLDALAGTSTSAGGNLALALVRYLRDSRDHESGLDLGMPGGLIAISPWADPVGTYFATLTDDSPGVVNAKTDYLRLVDKRGTVVSQHGYAARALAGPMSAEDATRSPYISPGSLNLTTDGLFKGEALIQEIRVLQTRMKKDCEVVYDEVVDAVHDFVAFPQWEPERSETFKKIVDWIQNL